jgi:hypothetical protein
VVGESFRAIDARLGHKNAAMAAGTPRETLLTASEAGLTLTDFRALTADFRASQSRASGGSAPVGGGATSAPRQGSH